MTYLRSAARRAWLPAWPVLFGIAACSGEPSAPAPSLAAGPSVFAAAAGTAVSSVVPDTSSISTTLDVRVRGSGFRSDASASWAFDGVVDESQVKVNRTTYVSSRELVANVTISGSARAGRWDVIVTMSGKTGVGTESVVGPDLFEVLDPNVTLLMPLDDAGLALRSDRAFSDGTYSAYTHGVCGVDGKIFATTQFSNTGDVRVASSVASHRKRCALYPRPVTRIFGDGTVETQPLWMNVKNVHNTASTIAIGQTVRRALLVSSSRCGAHLSWGRDGGDSVFVTRVDASTWDVETAPYPNNRAICLPSGPIYNMSVKFRIVSHRPLD